MLWFTWSLLVEQLDKIQMVMRYPKGGKGKQWSVRELNSIPAAWHRDTVSDGGGLNGLVWHSKQGTRVSFSYAFKYNGKLTRIQCGNYPINSLQEIRESRDEAQRTLRRGINPKEAEQSKRIKVRQEIAQAIEVDRLERDQLKTVNDLFDAWIASGVARKDDNASIIRTFQKDLLPRIGKIPLKDLSENDVREAYKKVITDRGVIRTAVLLAKDFTQMMHWAEQRQPWRSLLVSGNPSTLVDVMKLVPQGYTNERNRVVSQDELRQLARIFTQTEATYQTAPDRRSAIRPVLKETQCAIWIALSTVCRIGELLMAEWKHVDLEARTWLIPKENTKGTRATRQDQLVQLSDFSIRIFEELQSITGKTKWLFPAADKKSHINLKTVSKQIGDRQIKFKNRTHLKNRSNDDSLVLGDEKWTPHDLRRTGATMMQALGVPMEVIDRCQNHVLAGSKVRRSYMLHDYANEKRDAWNKLGDRLVLILNNDKVLFLDNKKAA